MTKKERAGQIIRRLKQLHPEAQMILNYKNNWELLVAVMLSAQSTDKQVNKVTGKLFRKYRKLSDYAGASRKTLEQDIKSIGLYRTKARNIMAAARMLGDEYGGVVPRTLKELIRLPGVGRKTAHVVLGNAYGLVEGIAVDTHVRRLTQSFGLTPSADPKKIEQDLMRLFPKKEWFHLTYLFIDYGRAHCPARCRHTDCPLQQYIVRRRPQQKNPKVSEL